MELYSGMGGTNVRTQWEEYSGLFRQKLLREKNIPQCSRLPRTEGDFAPSAVFYLTSQADEFTMTI